MRVEAGDRALDAEQVILCTAGLLDDRPDKAGAVEIRGQGGPRAALACAQAARWMLREYPEEAVFLGPGTPVTVEGTPRAGVDLLVVRARGGPVVASRWDAAVTSEALARLERYLTRLIRIDTP